MTGDTGMSVSEEHRLKALLCVTEKINSGISLEEVLDHAFHVLHAVIPYDRIGFSILEKDDSVLRAFWARSNSPNILLGKNYSAPMAGSSLQSILETKTPRILNDLPSYLARHPQSESTKLIVEEGMRSSLTCPLIAMAKPIGFIFFSSFQKDCYKDAHVEIFLQIAGNLSMIAEKSLVMARLRELNDFKNKFLGMAAHDLRNPITIIKGYADLLLEGISGDLAPTHREPVNVISQTCDKMLHLIEEFLDVSVIESGKLTIHLQKVVPQEFLARNIEMNRLLAKRKAINIRLEPLGDLPEIRMDPDRMDQVLNNLITNALKYSGSHTTITLKARMAGDQFEISVTDQGQGIPKEALTKLFQYFSKAGSKPTGKEGSTGLGLAISQKIVEAHEGKIRAESEPGKGSTFTVSIPAGKA